MKFLAVFVFFGAFVYSSQESQSDSLRLVHVFFRHGARTPELKDVYPNDPHKLEAFLPMGYGQLTNYGKQMAYRLGKLLRKQYASFLGDIFSPEMVYTQSTDFDRTKMTALLVLAGLFKPAPSQIWEEELQWMPIPVAYEKDEEDYVLKRPNSYCPTYVKVLEEILESEDIQNYLKEHKKTLDYATEHSGKPVNKLVHVMQLYQTLTAETWMNLTLPEWTQSVYPGEITRLAAKQCYLENSNAILKRLNGGRMLGKVIENMVAKTTNSLYPSERKIFLYSGHENNVINILAALDLYKIHFPKYSSAVIIELHDLGEDKGFAVRVLYSKDVNSEPDEQQMDGCDVLCPLNKFLKLTEPHVPVNYTAECNSSVYLD